jgi:predicted ester cyclase
MSEEDNKTIVGRWFTGFWGADFDPSVIDELAAPDIRFEYSLHAPCRGRDEVRALATKFRAAFPDLSFSGTADLIAEGAYVVGQWEGGGTQTGEAFDDMPIGSLPPNSGKTMRFTGITVLKVKNGLITRRARPRRSQKERRSHVLDRGLLLRARVLRAGEPLPALQHARPRRDRPALSR